MYQGLNMAKFILEIAFLLKVQACGYVSIKIVRFINLKSNYEFVKQYGLKINPIENDKIKPLYLYFFVHLTSFIVLR